MISLILRIRIRYGDIRHSTGTHRHRTMRGEPDLADADGTGWLAVLESGRRLLARIGHEELSTVNVLLYLYHIVLGDLSFLN